MRNSVKIREKKAFKKAKGAQIRIRLQKSVGQFRKVAGQFKKSVKQFKKIAGRFQKSVGQFKKRAEQF